MTPKEKADKLCIDFLMKPNTTDIRFGMDKQLAKQCAIIAVDEIRNDKFNEGILSGYWYEVRREIEKL